MSGTTHIRCGGFPTYDLRISGDRRTGWREADIFLVIAGEGSPSHDLQCWSQRNRGWPAMTASGVQVGIGALISEQALSEFTIDEFAPSKRQRSATVKPGPMGLLEDNRIARSDEGPF